jgi:hypothetical protein
MPQTTFLVNTPIVLDPAGPLYAAIWEVRGRLRRRRGN